MFHSHIYRKAGSYLPIMIAFALAFALTSDQTAASVFGNNEPVLRVNSNGSTSFVSSLAFSPDGKTLYSAGFDKVVRVWKWNQSTASFESDPRATYRIPIGPGRAGMINAIAVSADGRWLVVSGDSLIRGGQAFDKPGAVFPKVGFLSPEMRLDQGRIFVFDTLTREVKTLRFHNGPVFSPTFLPGSDRYFVSAADEWDETSKERIGKLRLFDVVSGEEIASANAPVVSRRPGIAPLSGSDNPRQARIALAWGDGKLRVWDVAAGRVIEVPDGTQENNAIGYSPETRRLLTGTFNIQDRRTVQGELNLWSVQGRDGRPVTVGAPSVLPRNGDAYPFPRALAILNQRERRSVVLTSRMTVPTDGLARIEGWEIGFFDLENDRLTMRRRVSLNRLPSADRTPVLAATPDGNWFALAGSGDQTIRVYRTDEIRAGEVNPYQRLSGTGRVMQDAYFVRNGDAIGLALNGNRDGESWVMSVTDRELIDGISRDWRPDRASSQGWTVASEVTVEGNRTAQTTLTIRGPALPAAGSKILLPEGHQFVTAAVLPNFDARDIPVDIPLVAVASTRSGLPRLAIYNAISGEAVRQLSGHVERIKSLSFSGDGRFLVSTGNDQTTCVWSMVDIDQTYGKRGGLNGLALDNRDGQVVVVEVDSNAATSDLLEQGDVIESIARGNERIEIEKSTDFYATMWKSEPGSTLSIIFGNGRRPVEVTVEQGIDERKPLFSMFVEKESDAEGNSRLSWVGWSPLGPFDSSGDEIEKHLGWHFNGEDQDDPVRFALLEEYPELRREGLLEGMLDEGKLPEIVAAPLDRPTMRLRIPGAPEAGPKLPTVLSEVPSSVELTVIGLTPREVQGVTLWIDGERVGEFEFAGNQRWRAETQLEDWARGSHRMTARLLTREVGPQTFDQSLEMSYYLAAPQIRLPNGRQDWTDEAQYTVTTRIVPGSNEPIDVELIRLGEDGSEVVKTWEVTEQTSLNEMVELKEGINRFQIYAVNRNATDSSVRAESRRVPVVVVYEPRIIASPTQLEVFLNSSADGKTGPLQPMLPGEIVRMPMLPTHLYVSTESREELPEIELTITGQEGEISKSLLEFERSDDKWLAIESPQIDQPGQYRISVHDLTNDAALYETNLLLLAGLPDITIVSPTGGEELISGRDEAQVNVELQIKENQFRAAYDLEFLLNDETIEPELEIRDERVVATIELQPGENKIHARVSNRFEESDSRPVMVYLRRPPTISTVEGELSDGPMATIVANVESHMPLEQATLNDKFWPKEKTEISGDASSWQVTFKEVPLAEGTNEFRVAIWNGEARVVEPSAIAIDYEPPAPPQPADVVVLSPQQAAVVDQASFELEFEVRSESRILQVEVLLGSAIVYRAEDVSSILVNRDGQFVLRASTNVDLAAGPNHFKIVTINAGGEQTETTVAPITYQEPPVRLTIEGVSLAGGDGEIIRPTLTGDGRIQFDQPVESDVVFIHAIADWRGLPGSFRNESTPTIQVLVNEFMQLSNGVVEGEVSRFKLPVLLSEEVNEIRVLLPHYRGEASSQATFQLQCTNPTPNKRLHLLIVGIGSTQEDSRILEDRVLESIGGKRLQNEKNFRTDTFQSGLIYGPVVGSDLDQGDIVNQLINIQDTISILQDQENYHDVLMLYVEGGRVVPYQGEFIVTTRPASSPISLRIADDPTRFQDYSLSTLALRAMVQATEGAKILMMDMLEGDTGEVANVKFDEESRAALLRFMWVKDEAEESPFPAFFNVIAQSRRSLTLNDLRSEFQGIADSYAGLNYQDWLSPGILDLILVNREREAVEN